MFQCWKIRIRIKILVKHFIFQFKLKYKIHLRALPEYLFVIGCIVPCVWVSLKTMEAIFMFIAFLFLRYKFKTTYHASSTGKCLFITIMVGYLSVPATVSFGMSLLQGIGVAFVVTFVSWYVQAFIDISAENELMKSRLALLESKSLLEMTDSEFVKHCQHRNLDDEEIKIAELFIRQGLKGQEFYEAIGYSMAQSKRKRKRILEKLNK